MSIITKEQAQKIIDAADAVITALAGTNEDVHPESDSMLHLWDDLNDRYAPPEVVRELARIALTSTEAEPVAWTDADELRDANNGGSGYLFSIGGDANKFADPRRQMMLYTAPPAPVSVMDEAQSRELFEKNCMANIERNKWHPDLYAHLPAREQWAAWEACRAAMLQGADGALTNEDTKRVDELVMWIKRLAHSLRKAKPDSKLQSDAMDYLSRKGLIGVEDILR